jgi:homoserine dehydrogenase
MKYIGILGFGIVGGGVAELIDQTRAQFETQLGGESVEVKRILDLRDFPGSPWADRVVRDVSAITDDPEISLVVEAMGGSRPAVDYTRACLKAGKHVVTSNKEVVANFGAELLALAAENNVRYMFEASVGGGIPIIRALRTGLRNDRITEIEGILNGTTNYILTRMQDAGLSFDDALAEAQKLGYAEANPSADIDGTDSQRKIVILSALATGALPDVSGVYVQSLRGIGTADIDAARRLGGAVKLVCRAKIEEEGVYLSVCPAILPFSNPLAHIRDVYNGVVVRGALTGDVMLYGRGAGRYPTAGAILSDIVSVYSGAEEAVRHESWTRGENILPAHTLKCRRYVRYRADAPESAAIAGDRIAGSPEGFTEVITPAVDDDQLAKMLAGAKITPVSVLRVF